MGLSHSEVGDVLSPHTDLSSGFLGGPPWTALWGSLEARPTLWSWKAKPPSPLLPAEGPEAEGWLGRGPGPTGCSPNNADIHPRQALALLASEGGTGGDPRNVPPSPALWLFFFHQLERRREERKKVEYFAGTEKAL